MLPIRKNGYGGKCRWKQALENRGGQAGLIQPAFGSVHGTQAVSQVIIKMRIICDNTMD